MASIFPDGGNGGVAVRDSSGVPIPVSGVPNAYIPPAAFTTSCDLNYLRDDCFSRISPAQMNAVTSELVCFANYLNPEGGWDCSSTCNLQTNFAAWVSRFVQQGVSEDLCLLPASAGREDDASVIYCGNGQALKLNIYGEDGLIGLVAEFFCSATPVLVPPPAGNFFFCDPDTGDIRSVPLALMQLYRGEWIQSEGYTTVNMVQRNGSLWTPNAPIIPGSPFVIGTTGATWREVSGTGFNVLNDAIAYPKDSVILHNGRFWASNDLIAAGTPFLIGTSGATWRPVDLTKTPTFDYNPARSYEQNSVVVVDGILYRAQTPVAATSAFNPASWQAIGGELNIYRGSWQQILAYRADDMVLVDDRLYVANGPIPSGAIFAIGTSGATWREVSKTELTGVEIDTEMVVFVGGGWDENETIMVYKCAKATIFPEDLVGSVGASAPSVNPISTEIGIIINGALVGIVFINEEVFTYSFANAVTMQPGDTLRLVARSEQFFEYISLNLFVKQQLT